MQRPRRQERLSKATPRVPGTACAATAPTNGADRGSGRSAGSNRRIETGGPAGEPGAGSRALCGVLWRRAGWLPHCAFGGEAVAAVHGPTQPGLEWHFRIAAAGGAYYGVHHTRRAVLAASGSTASRAALGAAAGLVEKSSLLVKVLFAFCEQELDSTLSANQALVTQTDGSSSENSGSLGRPVIDAQNPGKDLPSRVVAFHEL